MTRDEVIQRLREGSGEDRELDCALVPLLGGYVSDHPCPGDRWAMFPSWSCKEDVPAYTASVDPWLALARERDMQLDLRHGRHSWTQVILSGLAVACLQVCVRHTEPAYACALAYLEATKGD